VLIAVTQMKTWTLIGTNGKPFQSDTPGTLGGHRREMLYGLFDCRAATQVIARGGYPFRRRVEWPLL
jgi:hypothetical protein